MDQTDRQTRLSEHRASLSALRLRAAKLRYQTTTIEHAIDAFSDGTCVAKVPLTPKQTRWVKESMDTAKSMLPANLRIVTIAAERIGEHIAKKVAYLNVDLLPLLRRLKEDLDVQTATTERDIVKLRETIRSLESSG